MSMRRAASAGQLLHVISIPRGARTIRAPELADMIVVMAKPLD
jgi:hypothetical protein